MTHTSHGPYTDEHFRNPFEQIHLTITEDDFFNESTILNYLNDKQNPIWKQTFSDRLTGCIKKCGYPGAEDDLPAKVNFLWNMCQNTPGAEKEISKATLKNWFQETRPTFHADSRNRMFVLCFVLRLSYEEVQHFFHNVYLDRCFNCRDKREAVYCYCFSHNQDYRHALSLLKQIDTAFMKLEHSDIEHARENSVSTRYTSDFQEDILPLANDQELIRYMVKNRKSFLLYNVTGKKELYNIICKIKGIKEITDTKESSKDYELINKLRKNKTSFSQLTYKNFHGYLLREFFYSTPDLLSTKDVLDRIRSMDVFSNRFMLLHILGFHKDVPEEFYPNLESLTSIAHRNFPSEHILSKISRTAQATDHATKTSFDAIRKMLILLHFYQFNVGYFIGETVTSSSITQEYVRNFYKNYKEDADDLLVTCGYPPLYKGNPYDLIFLFCAKVEISDRKIRNISKGFPPSIPPLDAFREFVFSFTEYEEE